MSKKTLLIIALMAILIGTLVAQPMMHQAKRKMVEGNEMSYQYKNHHPRMQGQGHKAGRNMHKMMPGRMVLAMAEEIELTENQVDKIKEIQAAFTKMSNLKKAEIENLLIDKRNAMQEQNYKEAKNVIKDIYELREDLALSHVTAMENIHEELTDTQIEKLKDCRFNNQK